MSDDTSGRVRRPGEMDGGLFLRLPRAMLEEARRVSREMGNSTLAAFVRRAIVMEIKRCRRNSPSPPEDPGREAAGEQDKTTAAGP